MSARRRHIACGAFAAALLAAKGVPAAVVDDFSTPQALVAEGPLLIETWSQVPSPGSLGGERDVYLLLSSGSSINVDIGAGVMSYVEDAASDGHLYVVWDGVDQAPQINKVGLGGIDLTEGGTIDAFRVQVLVNVEHATNLGFLAYSSTEDYSIAYFEAPPGASTQIVSFADFAPLGSGVGVDFANLGALALFSLAEVEAQGMDFGPVETLPEPPRAAALTVGAVAIALARRRRS